MNRILSAIILTFITASIFTTQASAGKKLRIAILDITSINAPKTHGEAVRNILEVALHKTDAYEILERNQMENILKEQGLQMSGCTDTSCAVEMGKILSADMVVIGSINKLGNYTITIKFIDIAKGRIEFAEDEVALSDEDIQPAVNRLSKRMAMKNNKGIPVEEKKVIVIEKKRETPGDKKREEPVKGDRFIGNSIGFSVDGLYISPIGSFKELLGPGSGAMLTITGYNLFMNNLNFGVESGYLKFQGKKENIDYSTMIPVLLKADYRIGISRMFYVAPVIGGGISYDTLTYKSTTAGTANNNALSRNNIAREVMARAGIQAGFSIGNMVTLRGGADYGTIYEKKGRMNFISVYGGGGVSF